MLWFFPRQEPIGGPIPFFILAAVQAKLQRDLLDQESNTARVHSEYQQARIESDMNEQLKKNGLVAELQYKTSQVKAAELLNRDAIEEKRLNFARDSIEPTLRNARRHDGGARPKLAR